MPGPATPCRYPTPLPKYGSVSRCKDGVKAPCVTIPECWAHAGGDVVKSMHCQQEYVRDLAMFLFKTDLLFRNTWINYVKSYDLADFQRRSTSGKNSELAYKQRAVNYDNAIKAVDVSNDATKFAEQQLDMLVAGERFSSAGINAFKAGLSKLLQDAFSSLFVFVDGKIDYTRAPVGKFCRDIEHYFTFIEAVNLLLTQGMKSRGGRRVSRRTNKKSKRSTRRY